MLWISCLTLDLFGQNSIFNSTISQNSRISGKISLPNGAAVWRASSPARFARLAFQLLLLTCLNHLQLSPSIAHVPLQAAKNRKTHIFLRPCTLHAFHAGKVATVATRSHIIHCDTLPHFHLFVDAQLAVQSRSD